MKKRGQLVYKALVVIVGSALIIAAFVQAGKSYGSQEAFYKLAIAKDLALTIDLLYALPGNVEYVYPNDVSRYDIELRDNKVTIYDTNQGRLDTNQKSYNYVGSETNSINAYIKNQKSVKFDKINSAIIVTGVNK